jgi:16S rRNA C967 or C1407 C5-methylase (RsmB/RsmF family)
VFAGAEENEAVVAAALDGAPEFKVAGLQEELEKLRQSGELCWRISRRFSRDPISGQFPVCILATVFCRDDRTKS